MRGVSGRCAPRLRGCCLLLPSGLSPWLLVRYTRAADQKASRLLVCCCAFAVQISLWILQRTRTRIRPRGESASTLALAYSEGGWASGPSEPVSPRSGAHGTGRFASNTGSQHESSFQVSAKAAPSRDAAPPPAAPPRVLCPCAERAWVPLTCRRSRAARLPAAAPTQGRQGDRGLDLAIRGGADAASPTGMELVPFVAAGRSPGSTLYEVAKRAGKEKQEAEKRRRYAARKKIADSAPPYF